MNFKHAIGFMVVGATLGALPSIAPGWCGVDDAAGTSARELWLQLMSTLQIGIAMAYFAGRVLASLGVLLETTATPVKSPEFELPVFAETEATFEVVRVPNRRPSRAAVLPLPMAVEQGLGRAA